VYTTLELEATKPTSSSHVSTEQEVHGKWKPVTQRQLNGQIKEETNRQRKKDTILPSSASSSCCTALFDYIIISRSDNGMSLSIDYGTLCPAYNSESIFKKPRKYSMTSKTIPPNN
jgi:hypothetical protein